MSGADRVLILSHAGVAADRDILPLLPDGSLMIGGHNHLLFQHPQGRSAYAHTGSWTSAYTVGEFRADGSVTAARVVRANPPRVFDRAPQLADEQYGFFSGSANPRGRQFTTDVSRKF